ncbi:MAG: acetyl-CoA carboxylase, carboxyltransferase subunit beta [Candidatus Pacebacteria bacterium]|nr:acetyl-CoA carboxylase, carboxyltransferase subunit beta [Candidatus Paceibacterota bacterium]
MPLFRKLQYSTVRTPKKDIPEGLWMKCKGCGVVIYRSKVEENMHVCPQCGYHYPLTAMQRIHQLTDPNSFAEIDRDLTSVDVLDFAGDGVYPEKLAQSQKKTGMKDAILCGTAKLHGHDLALGVMDFRFLGASMGSVVGEKVARLVELAAEKRMPLVIVTASGGARMYEGMMSLMQMAKTSGALAVFSEAGLPYIVVMTHPTTAGVSASFASLGDVILAEPGALIGFAGPRVIKQTTQSELPEGFQTAEFLMEHGFIDRVVERAELRRELDLLLTYLAPSLDVS